MKRFYFVAYVLTAGIITASSASADIYSDCEDAIKRGDTSAVQVMAGNIQRFKTIPFRSQALAEACVSAGVGSEVVFESNKGEFILLAELEERTAQGKKSREANEEAERVAAEEEAVRAAGEKEAVRRRVCELRVVVNKTNQTLQLAEVAQQGKRIEALAATIKECSAWLESDARAALTNDVCNSFFSSGGLPNSEISGPTASETLQAEITNKNANAELKFLIEFGVSLVMTYTAMAAEMELSEGGDPYACDQ